jgi:hypothetical protein
MVGVEIDGIVTDGVVANVTPPTVIENVYVLPKDHEFAIIAEPPVEFADEYVVGEVNVGKLPEIKAIETFVNPAPAHVRVIPVPNTKDVVKDDMYVVGVNALALNFEPPWGVMLKT